MSSIDEILEIEQSIIDLSKEIVTKQTSIRQLSDKIERLHKKLTKVEENVKALSLSLNNMWTVDSVVSIEDYQKVRSLLSINVDLSADIKLEIAASKSMIGAIKKEIPQLELSIKALQEKSKLYGKIILFSGPK